MIFPDIIAVKQPMVQKPRENKPAHNAPPEITAAAKVQPASDSLNWSDLVFQLGLDGVAKQIVMNSVVNGYSDGRLQLVFQPELEVMLKGDIESQIKQAIECKLGVSLILEFSSRANLGTETPHQADVRKQEQHRQQVIQSIKKDPVVVQLHTVFGAELVEDSVKKT